MNKADVSKVRVEVRWHQDMWQEVKNATMTTIGKDSGEYPDSDWKRRLLMAEHSPIRIPQIILKVYDAPQFVHGHLVRHSNGVTPFVSTLRNDRNDYDEIPNRHTLQSAEYSFNLQAFINMTRKRDCSCASYETRFVWNKILDAIADLEPELRSVCVKECVYRGFCPEMFSCKHHKTKAFEQELREYRRGINE
jgi:hypothetical protein